MIVCKDCGHRNANGTTFCDSCGTFLEWGGESVLTGAHQAIPAPEAPPAAPVAPEPPAPAATPAPPAAPETPAEPAGAAFQAQRLPVISDPEAPPPPSETPLRPALGGAVPPASPPPAPPPAAAPDEPKAPGAARPGTQVLRAMRMKARPPAPPAAPPAGPAARPPAEEQARRPPRPPAAEPARQQANPGDVFCSSCGTPNDPSRNYCRSCGNQLNAAAPAAPAPRVSWWRRLLGRGPKGATVAPAGTRHAAGTGKGGGRKAMGAGQGAVNSVAHLARRLFQIIAILGVLGIGVIAIGPWRNDAKDHVRGWIDDARRIVQPHYSKVTPTQISSSSALRADPPQNAFDGILETFWAEGVRGDGTGESLTASFEKPTDLSRIGLTVGDQAKPQFFATHPVPKTVELVLYDADGAVVKRETLNVEQTAKFQKFDADAKAVSRVVLTIRSTYPPVKGTKSSAAIAEVELFTKD